MGQRKHSGYSRIGLPKRDSITFLNQCLNIESKDNINQAEGLRSHLERKVQLASKPSKLVKDQLDEANLFMNSLKTIGIDDGQSDLDKVGRLRMRSKLHSRAQSALIRPQHARSNTLFRANLLKESQGGIENETTFQE